jgi:pimeloyl-[acyl-carrier protein] synthase
VTVELGTAAWPFSLQDPYPGYADRRAAGPLHPLPELGCSLVVAHREAEAILRGSEWSSDARSSAALAERLGSSAGMLELGGASVLSRDGAEHSRLRRSLGSFFSPRGAEALRPRVRAIVSSALGALEPGEPFELMDEVAYPVPLAVMCELLDTGTDLALTLRNETSSLVGLLDPLADEEAVAAGVSAALGLMLELVPLVAERRAAPGEDLLSALAHESSDLAPDEAVVMALVLLVAGHETTANLVGNAMAVLHETPDLLRRLQGDPGLVPAAVEEVLRYESPVQLASRIAREAVRVGETVVEPGSQVLVSLGAANRDPAAYPDPDRVDLERTPRQHLAFGHGAHFCAGASVARLEAAEVLTRLLTAVPDFGEREITVQRGESPTFRRVSALHVLAS